MLNRIIKLILRPIIFLGFPFTFLAALWFKLIRKVGIGYMDEKIFMSVGVLPIIDHYYEPLIDPRKHLVKSLREDRNLPGIDLNAKEQLELLAKFNYNHELVKFPVEKAAEGKYYYNNGFYEAADAEYYYSMIRFFKPKQIIEIGSGYSTLMAQNAFAQNKADDISYNCKYYSIEPYEQPWLEKLDVGVIRKRVETIDTAFFEQLEANDILFIDSTHMIRPQGDVLFEYLEILPVLKPGVIIQIHDIHLPKDYLSDWIYEHRFWNEQYLLEAFLTYNSKFKIIGALNYLTHHHYDEFAAKNPVFRTQPGREPGAFWMIKTA
ncbi:MAG TPA: class I SAM-dependent methyltransferase [Mucilaginibacter sp.]|nr:class I SAM-dependent methyltransferase [Mucilaginibacter sp.]